MRLQHWPRQHARKRRYMPVIALLAAMATLILVLGLTTSRNLTLARQRLEEALSQQGLMLTRALEAGSRAGMRMHWRSNQLQTLVEEFGAMPKVRYITVMGAQGTIVAATDAAQIGRTTALPPAITQLDPGTFTTQTLARAAEAVFEITAKIDATAAHHEATPSGRGMGMGRQMNAMMGDSPGWTELSVIQVGLSLAELQAMQRRDLQNAALLLCVLSALGSAALYGIVTAQNYYAVHDAFQTMQSYTRHVVESMANGLISVDTAGRIVTMNRQAAHILALPPETSYEGRALAEVMRLAGADCANVLNGACALEQEVTCMTPSHAALPLSLSASTLTDDAGERLGVVLLFRDLREVKALQEQIARSERLAAIGQLAAGVAHEIRNPLGSLKGFLQYFQRKLALPEQERAYLTVMVNEVDRLNAVVSNLLEFARPKDTVRTACDVAELLRHVVTLIEGDFEAKQVALTLTADPELPPIALDHDQITQVVLNLLLNALHATAAGGQVSVAADMRPDAPQLEISVTDTGSGIAAADLPHIFDPFFSAQKRGTGLGLAIAHTMIQNHRGEIRVSSEPGRGSTFRLRLPLA